MRRRRGCGYGRGARGPHSRVRSRMPGRPRRAGRARHPRRRQRRVQQCAAGQLNVCGGGRVSEGATGEQGGRRRGDAPKPTAPQSPAPRTAVVARAPRLLTSAARARRACAAAGGQAAVAAVRRGRSRCAAAPARHCRTPARARGPPAWTRPTTSRAGRGRHWSWRAGAAHASVGQHNTERRQRDSPRGDRAPAVSAHSAPCRVWVSRSVRRRHRCGRACPALQRVSALPRTRSKQLPRRIAQPVHAQPLRQLRRGGGREGNGDKTSRPRNESTLQLTFRHFNACSGSVTWATADVVRRTAGRAGARSPFV